MAQERWPREHAQRLLAAWRESGKTIVEFAQERGMDPTRLYYWRRVLEREEAPRRPRKKRQKAKVRRLLPVIVGTTPPTSVDLAQLARDQPIEAEWVAKFIRALFSAAHA